MRELTAGVHSLGNSKGGHVRAFLIDGGSACSPSSSASVSNRPTHVPCPVDEALVDGDSFGPLEALHVPGHSPGTSGCIGPNAAS